MPLQAQVQQQMQLMARKTTVLTQRRSARQSTSLLCSWKRLRPAQEKRMRRHSQSCKFSFAGFKAFW